MMRVGCTSWSLWMERSRKVGRGRRSGPARQGLQEPGGWRASCQKFFGEGRERIRHFQVNSYVSIECPCGVSATRGWHVFIVPDAIREGWMGSEEVNIGACTQFFRSTHFSWPVRITSPQLYDDICKVPCETLFSRMDYVNEVFFCARCAEMEHADLHRRSLSLQIPGKPSPMRFPFYLPPGHMLHGLSLVLMCMNCDCTLYGGCDVNF